MANTASTLGWEGRDKVMGGSAGREGRDERDRESDCSSGAFVHLGSKRVV